MYELEERFVNDFGFVRRASLGVLTNSGKEIYDMFQEDRESEIAFVYVYDELPAYVKRLEDTLELMNAALARLLLSYAGRADMEEVLEEGRRPGKEH